MKLTWLGHAAFHVAIGDAVILIDPFLTGNPTLTGDASKWTEGVTHILLSHGHGDHVGDTVAIAKANGAAVVADADLATYLAHKGVANVQPMNSGGTLDLGAFRVSMTVAHHSSGSVDENGIAISLGQAHGLVVRAPGEKTLYFAGDTDIFSDMALIDEIYEPKIGILPIGDRFTMGGELAALAARRFFHFETVIPCHYGTFGLLDQTPDKFIAGMQGADAKVVVPAVGETLTL
ncbi:UPF0173 metal-dependent hydrolase [Kaistia sp. 32K]|uniref:metal-dependent hydrolase n=1 Tax=Kaistia sp. 32K TaxID=2795690 RepID=UPI001915C093|nr:metal-dependent hydrolase [Kaistia sp. 32K]BCP54882.1 UPF0173 metal-dependent hydrolase [Kaistia sp. 32K]